MIYFAFVHSQILYVIEVYVNTFSTYLIKLSVLNNKLLRILQHKSIKTPNIELYETYSTLPVRLLHNFQILILMHKYVYHRDPVPSVFSSYFEENTLIHYQYSTKTYFIFLLYPLNMEKGPSNIKVLNFGIIFLSILRKLNHCSLLRIKYKNLYYSLRFNDLYLY